ncbi:hypothetical protein HispidOSU_014289, partial [Sigmodon hispidus]
SNSGSHGTSFSAILFHVQLIFPSTIQSQNWASYPRLRSLEDENLLHGPNSMRWEPTETHYMSFGLLQGG